MRWHSFFIFSIVFKIGFFIIRDGLYDHLVYNFTLSKYTHADKYIRFAKYSSAILYRPLDVLKWAYDVIVKCHLSFPICIYINIYVHTYVFV